MEKKDLKELRTIVESDQKNRMPVEVIRILGLGREPNDDDVRKLFSLDDMIMYIINFLEDPQMHAPDYDYEGGIAKVCAEELGDWFWTIFSKGKRCTKWVPPI